MIVAIDDVEHGKSQGNQILEKGIEQLRLDRMRVKHEVDVALADRGRVWHEANLVRANADTGEITATVDEPSPHGIEPKTTLFVFEQNDKEKGGTYLGEFTVTCGEGWRQANQDAAVARAVARRIDRNLSQPRPLGFVRNHAGR